MYEYLWMVPAFPFLGALTLMLFGRRLPRVATAIIGPAAVGVPAAVSVWMGYHFLTAPPEHHAFTQTLWCWFNVAGFAPNIALYLDPLSLTMICVVTVIGFLIHIYSIEYMTDDPDYARFFACMNLFVGSMLMLVLGDSLVLLYLGWEGVGLCSYLLIGFWYKDHANGRAAMKAFITTRVGDASMGIGLFLLFWQLGTLNIQELMTRAEAQWAVGSGVAVLAALLLLGGAVGKSGQLPLQVWLPDAMAGPTPVSALIHAATMVTAGVYLIARTHVLFEIAPAARMVVAAVGVLTLLIAGFAAMAQRDIKRVLAYSTISQIGYMFLALGVGAWSAAIFHLMTHAFFKALLFMAAGAIIVSLHHEQDMFKMGGLWKRLPLVFVTFLIGAASLASLPLVTAGFYSKDFILWNVWCCPDGGKILWIGAWIGALFTATYTFRMVFITFFGEEHGHVHSRPGWAMSLPLVLLAIGATFVGFLETPRTIHDLPLFSEFMGESFPNVFEAHGSFWAELAMQIGAQVFVLSGLALAYVLFLRRRELVAQFVERREGAWLRQFCLGGCGFDDLYRFLFIRPFEFITRINKNDIVDSIYNGTAAICMGGHYLLSLTQTGRLRWYMMGIAAGAAFAIAWVVFV